MVVLTLECTGDDSSTATATFTLPSDITFSTCTLHSVDVDVASSVTEDYWTKAETGDNPVAGRDVYAPLYLALRPFCDRGEILTMADSTLAHDLIPLATAEPETGVRQNPRVRDLIIARGSRTLAAGTEVSAQLFYRSVETGVYGNIQSFASGTFSDDCRLSVTLVLE
jgi:hypothetical protein